MWSNIYTYYVRVKLKAYKLHLFCCNLSETQLFITVAGFFPCKKLMHVRLYCFINKICEKPSYNSKRKVYSISGYTRHTTVRVLYCLSFFGEFGVHGVSLIVTVKF